MSQDNLKSEVPLWMMMLIVLVIFGVVGGLLALSKPAPEPAEPMPAAAPRPSGGIAVPLPTQQPWE